MSPRVKAPPNPFLGTGPNTRAFREQARRWLTFIGQRGGLATSPRKRAASVASLEKARAARAAKREVSAAARVRDVTADRIREGVSGLILMGGVRRQAKDLPATPTRAARASRREKHDTDRGTK